MVLKYGDLCGYRDQLIKVGDKNQNEIDNQRIELACNQEIKILLFYIYIYTLKTLYWIVSRVARPITKHLMLEKHNC